MREPDAQHNAWIGEKVKNAVKILATRMKKTQNEITDSALALLIYVVSDLEDLEQTREFVEIRPRILRIIMDTENPEKKEKLRKFLGIKEGE